MMRAALGRALLGLVAGAVAGGLAVAVALGRASLIRGVGRGGAPFVEHRPALALALLAAFGLGGALLGVLAPLRRSTLGAVALSLVAATGFLATVFVALQGTPAGWSRSTWWALGLGTLALGAVLADKVQPSDR